MASVEALKIPHPNNRLHQLHLDDFLNSEYVLNKSKETQSAYKTDVSQFVNYIRNFEGMSDISQIGSYQANVFLKRLERKMAPGTTMRKRASIKQFFSYLEAEGIIQPGNEENVWRIININPSNTETLSQVEIDKLRQALSCNVQYAAFVEIILQSAETVENVRKLKTNNIEICSNGYNLQKVSVNFDSSKYYNSPIEMDRYGSLLLVQHLASKPRFEESLFGYCTEPITRQGVWLQIKPFLAQIGRPDANLRTIITTARFLKRNGHLFSQKNWWL